MFILAKSLLYFLGLMLCHLYVTVVNLHFSFNVTTVTFILAKSLLYFLGVMLCHLYMAIVNLHVSLNVTSVKFILTRSWFDLTGVTLDDARPPFGDRFQSFELCWLKFWPVRMNQSASHDTSGITYFSTFIFVCSQNDFVNFKCKWAFTMHFNAYFNTLIQELS